MVSLTDYHLQQLDRATRDTSSSSSASSDAKSDGSNSSFSSMCSQNRDAFRSRHPERAARDVHEAYARPQQPASKRSTDSPNEREFKGVPKAFGGSMSRPEWLDLTHGTRVEPRSLPLSLSHKQ